LFALFAGYITQATHLRGGYISVIRISPNSLTCKVKLTIFVNTESPVRFSGGLLDFGDGTSLSTPDQNSIVRPDLGPSVGWVEFVTTHEFPGEGGFLISYTEPNRNSGILNMSQSVNTRFHIETYFMLDSEKSALVHPVAPLVFATSIGRSPISFSVGVHDSSDYRVQYNLVSPKQGRGLSVVGYSIPAGVSLNPYNGLFTWNFSPDGSSPFQGEYAFTVRAESYDAQNNLRGFTIFDFQVVLTDGPAGTISDDRSLDEKNRIYVINQESITVTFQFDTSFEPNWSLRLYTFLPTENASLTVSEIPGSKTKTGLLKLKNTSTIERSSPYLVVIRASLSGVGVYDIPYLFFTQNNDYTEIIEFPEELLQIELPVEKRSLWPNPTDGYLIFRDIEGRPATFSVLKLTGEEIASGEINWAGELFLYDLAAGVYIVRIDDVFYRIVKK
jgi:hypothetical protein